MGRVFDGDWSPRSRDPPAPSRSAYSHPLGAQSSSYGDYNNSNLQAVDGFGSLQQPYLDMHPDHYVANTPNFPYITNNVAEDQGSWLQTSQFHAEYDEVLSRSIAEPLGTIQTGGVIAGPQQELPGMFVVLISCIMTPDTESADIHCDIHAKLANPRQESSWTPYMDLLRTHSTVLPKPVIFDMKPLGSTVSRTYTRARIIPFLMLSATVRST